MQRRLKLTSYVMKRISTAFLQTVIVLIGIVALIILIWFPLTEGRATHLDLFSTYADPFILYGYGASMAFFVALYNAFRLLGYIGQNKVFSTNSVKNLKNIKHCAILLSILIVVAGLFIRLTHNTEDDPAGFLAICIVTTFVAIVVATAVAVFEKLLQNAIDMYLVLEKLYRFITLSYLSLTLSGIECFSPAMPLHFGSKIGTSSLSTFFFR